MGKGSGGSRNKRLSDGKITTEDKRDAIQSYVDQNAAIQSAVSSDYADGNFLYEIESKENLLKAKSRIKALDSSFENTTEDMVLYSGKPSVQNDMLGKKLSKHFINGGEVYVDEDTEELVAFKTNVKASDLSYTDKFYVTATKSLNIARSYAGIGESEFGDQTKAVYRIHVPKGTPVIDTNSKKLKNIGVKTHDNDVILPRGTKYRVSKNIDSDGDVIYYDLYIEKTKNH